MDEGGYLEPREVLGSDYFQGLGDILKSAVNGAVGAGRYDDEDIEGILQKAHNERECRIARQPQHHFDVKCEEPEEGEPNAERSEVQGGGEVEPSRTMTYKRVLLYGEPTSLKSRFKSRASGLGEVVRELPTTRWGAGGELWRRDDFQEAMKRMDRYVRTWNYGRGGENAFDELASEPSVVTENFVIGSRMMDVARARRIRKRYVSRANLDKWGCVIMNTAAGQELFRWFKMLVVDYCMVVEVREVDAGGEGGTESKSKSKSKLKDSDLDLDLEAYPMVGSRATARRLMARHGRGYGTYETLQSAHKRGQSERDRLVQDDEGDEGARDQDRDEDKDMPYARVYVHHSMISALHHYKVSAQVRICASGHLHPPGDTRNRRHTDKPILYQAWSNYAWETIVSNPDTMRRYNYYQDTSDIPLSVSVPEDQPVPQGQSPQIPTRDSASAAGSGGRGGRAAPLGERFWRSDVCVLVQDARRRHDHRYPCDVLVEAPTNPPEHVMNVPAEATRAKLCIQVVLRMEVPWTDDHGVSRVVEVEFDTVPDEIQQIRFCKRGRKRTPFNCNDPFCDGIIDYTKRCMHIPLDKASWVDELNKVRLDVSSSLVHQLTFPFVWGHSLVRADVQVRDGRSPEGDPDLNLNPELHSGLMGMVNACSDDDDKTTKQLVLSNVTFVCSTDMMQLALSELLDHERRARVDPADMEILRTAGVFLKRVK